MKKTVSNFGILRYVNPRFEMSRILIKGKFLTAERFRYDKTKWIGVVQIDANQIANTGALNKALSEIFRKKVRISISSVNKKHIDIFGTSDLQAGMLVRTK